MNLFVQCSGSPVQEGDGEVDDEVDEQLAPHQLP